DVFFTNGAAVPGLEKESPRHHNRLFRNEGGLRFADVTERAGLRGTGYNVAAAVGDYDNDGDPDLFVANDTTPNYLYRNNGDGTFTDVAVAAGVAYSEDGREQAGMGVEFEDLDNDGWLDIMVTNFSDDYNALYRNTGRGEFRDDSSAAGLVVDSWRDLSWGVGFFDFNNDGRKDVFVANGHIYPQVDRAGLNLTYRQTNKLYLNSGGPKLQNVSAQAGPGLAIARSFRGAAFADFNNDGWIDVAVAALDDYPVLLMNQGIPGNHWLMVHLKGRGVGARITVKAGGLTQIREVKAGGSFASSNDPRAHFGLGQATVIDELLVKWPSGKTSRLTSVPADQILAVDIKL
ncbi:MAG: CRTAC1 family protein, partial [Gammaproteobacteria bacterium]